MHLETKQMLGRVLGSVSASLFQLKQLRITFYSGTSLKPCLWNRGIKLFIYRDMFLVILPNDTGHFQFHFWDWVHNKWLVELIQIFPACELYKLVYQGRY